MLINKVYKYISYRYVKACFSVFSLVLILLFVFTSFDTLNNFKSVNISLLLIVKLVLLKLPNLFNTVLPLMVFLSSIYMINQLSISREIIAIYNCGKSLSLIVIPMMIIAFIIGIISILLINPIASICMSNYYNIEDRLLPNKKNAISSIDQGITILENYKNLKRIILAKDVNINSKELNDVNMLFLDNKQKFLKRIDASKAFFQGNNIVFINPKIHNRYHVNIKRNKISIPTNLNIRNFVEGTVRPSTLSVWQIPSYINKIMKSGFVAVTYKAYLYKQLYRPLFLISVVILAACISKTYYRGVNEVNILYKAVIIGFLIYVFAELFTTILVYKGIYVEIASLLPIIITLTLSKIFVLNLQER